MTAPADPRKDPGFKRLRQEQQVVALLGAILDALKPAPAVVDALAPRTRKQDKR
jgi:hypothetical protein